MLHGLGGLGNDLATLQAALEGISQAVYGGAMKRIYDIDDRAFLPWRFFGQSKSVIAAL
ncbi:hypothetical protein ACS3QZ_15930 [Shimia sp. W99]|uniref:Uncharacterized protein n=1 Tax=Shimia aestuarii TaxID=254406 RepID=A0A1I4MF37_9RHOB|nr:hypothetical protein [Shimia aestuarii]SFM01849.1 hypothetical protein SAMN04488042_10348 [Shimia aestuarii]